MPPIRETVATIIRDGHWRHMARSYRLWRAETARWGSTKRVWEYVGKDPSVAIMMMDGSRSEEELRETGRQAAASLREGLSITPKHTVLEVGCGVARIGRELAPHTGEWWGCDISRSIIGIARRRTAHLPNVRLVGLEDSSLRVFADDFFDRVYCHVVFMHLCQEDIFGYVQEMRRVVKPGGLVFFDAISLNADAGWERLRWEVEHYRGRKARPVHHSRFSTPQEMQIYAMRAGLILLHCLEPGIWVQLVGSKPPLDCQGDEACARLAEALRRQVNPEALSRAV